LIVIAAKPGLDPESIKERMVGRLKFSLEPQRTSIIGQRGKIIHMVDDNQQNGD